MGQVRNRRNAENQVDLGFGQRCGVRTESMLLIVEGSRIVTNREFGAFRGGGLSGACGRANTTGSDTTEGWAQEGGAERHFEMSMLRGKEKDGMV